MASKISIPNPADAQVYAAYTIDCSGQYLARPTRSYGPDITAELAVTGWGG